MVDGRRGRRVGVGQKGVVQIFHIEKVRPRVHPTLLLVELVANDKVSVVLGEPPLVGVRRAAVPFGGDQGGVCWVRDVHNGDGVLIARKSNLFALVLGVRADVVDDLGVVGVSVLRKRPEDGWVQRILNVDDVQSA